MNKLFILTKFSIIIHLGKNPKKGGSPPKESILVINKNLRNGELDLYIKSWLILKKLYILNSIMIE